QLSLGSPLQPRLLGAQGVSQGAGLLDGQFALRRCHNKLRELVSAAGGVETQYGRAAWAVGILDLRHFRHDAVCGDFGRRGVLALGPLVPVIADVAKIILSVGVFFPRHFCSHLWSQTRHSISIYYASSSTLKSAFESPTSFVITLRMALVRSV